MALQTKRTILTDNNLKVTRGEMPHEITAEIHALKRLAERYGIQRAEGLEVMFEHLAMILVGATKKLAAHRAGPHKGNEIHEIEWQGRVFLAAYDPRIRRIATYLVPGVHQVREIETSRKRYVYPKRKR